MTHLGNPFGPPARDPFRSMAGQPATGYPPAPSGWPFVTAPNPYPPRQQHHNTFAVLSPIFAVLVPPAGVSLGHLALPQIRRTGERGRWAAIWGLIIGYLMCLGLVAGTIGWANSSDSGSTPPTAAPSTVAQPLPPVVVTSVAPPSVPPRAKLDLTQVTVGTCAEIQKRDIPDDALDLYGVACEHRTGVYTVVARVATDTDCHSTYVAAPPDHSFALCLNPY